MPRKVSLYAASLLLSLILFENAMGQTPAAPVQRALAEQSAPSVEQPQSPLPVISPRRFSGPRSAPAPQAEQGSTAGIFPAGDRLVGLLTLGLDVSTLLLCWVTRALVKSSERTAERQLRAYLQVTKALLMWPSKPAIHVEVRNSGSTPAYNIGLQVSVFVDDPTLKREPDLPAQRPSARANVGGGETFKFEYPIGRLPDDDIQQIESGAKALYISGEITYADIFSKSRFTGLRYMLTGTVPSYDEAVEMQISDSGNETSESLAETASRSSPPRRFHYARSIKASV